MSTESEEEYVLGTQDDELQRLGFQHAVWSGVTTRLWELARFAPGDALVDLGCGPGYATLDLARLVGEQGHVLGVDVSKRFLSALAAQCDARAVDNVSMRLTDGGATGVAASSVDGVFARWVLSFTADPAGVVKEIARVLRPGGRVAILDYANYEAFSMAPSDDAITTVLRATGASIRERGGDFEIGRRLPTLLADAGFHVDSLEPIVRIARPGDALWQWPATFFANYLPVLVERGLITAHDSDEFKRVWRERTENPSAYLITPTMVGITASRR